VLQPRDKIRVPGEHAGAEPPQSVGLSKREKTWIAMILAPGATPENGTAAPAPLPAEMPATCVPCQQVSIEQLTPAPGPSAVSWPLGHKVTLTCLTVLE